MLSDATPIVFLLDVDNTLLDNDRFSADLDARLCDGFGAAGQLRYREIYQRLRDQHGYADYLGALQEFRDGVDEDRRDALQAMSGFMLDYPFDQIVYPGVREVIERLARIGTPVILSDGDMVFQPRKVERSGLSTLVGGRVLITLHKERSVAATMRQFPGDRYVVVDDKPDLLSAMKAQLGTRLMTVFVRQGHYAQSADLESMRCADLVIDDIAELADIDDDHFTIAFATAEDADPRSSTSGLHKEVS